MQWAITMHRDWLIYHELHSQNLREDKSVKQQSAWEHNYKLSNIKLII